MKGTLLLAIMMAKNEILGADIPGQVEAVGGMKENVKMLTISLKTKH